MFNFANGRFFFQFHEDEIETRCRWGQKQKFHLGGAEWGSLSEVEERKTREITFEIINRNEFLSTFEL